MPDALDVIDDLRVALCAIANADAAANGLRSLMGRDVELCVLWDDLKPHLDAERPVLAYMILPSNIIERGDGEGWRATVQLTAFVQGNDAQQKADRIVGRCVDLFTAPAFDGQGLDAAPYMLRRLQVGQGLDYTRRIHRSDLEIEIDLSAP